MIKWIKENKVLLAIIGTLTFIVSAIITAFLVFFGIKDVNSETQTNNILNETENEGVNNNVEQQEINNNVNSSNNSVNGIRDKVF